MYLPVYLIRAHENVSVDASIIPAEGMGDEARLMTAKPTQAAAEQKPYQICIPFSGAALPCEDCDQQLRQYCLQSLETAQRYGWQKCMIQHPSACVTSHDIALAAKTLHSNLIGTDLTIWLRVPCLAKDGQSSHQYASIHHYLKEHYRDLPKPQILYSARAYEKPVGRPFSETCSQHLMTSPLPEERACESLPPMAENMPISSVCPDASLQEALSSLDEGFSQMVLRLIEKKGMKDSTCYHKANIDRKLFSKIRSDPYYRPSKPTAVAFALALELSLAQTEQLLKTAGFALSHSSKFDIIIEYCITHQIYDVMDVNQILFDFDQTLLGTAS